MFLGAYLGWSLKQVAQNYLFIPILSAKMSHVNKDYKFGHDHRCFGKPAVIGGTCVVGDGSLVGTARLGKLVQALRAQHLKSQRL